MTAGEIFLHASLFLRLLASHISHPAHFFLSPIVSGKIHRPIPSLILETIFMPQSLSENSTRDVQKRSQPFLDCVAYLLPNAG
jgi:hypothetical protein